MSMLFNALSTWTIKARKITLYGDSMSRKEYAEIVIDGFIIPNAASQHCKPHLSTGYFTLNLSLGHWPYYPEYCVGAVETVGARRRLNSSSYVPSAAIDDKVLPKWSYGIAAMLS